MTPDQRLQNLGQHFVDRFAKHVISELPSRSWKVRDPSSCFYWFTITWSPGSLVLNGDCYSLIATHYQAMRTAEDAAHWVYGSSYDYFMGKTNAEKVYCPDATAEHIASHIFDDRCKKAHKKDCDACDYTDKLLSRLEKHIDGVYFRDKPQRTKKAVIKFIQTHARHENDMYELLAAIFDDPSEMLQNRYEEITQTQYAAFQTWAKLVTEKPKEDASQPQSLLEDASAST